MSVLRRRQRLPSTFYCFLVIMFGPFLLGRFSVALAQPYPNQAAVVLIKASCRDPATGGISEPIGSGYVFEQSGLILTAYHVVSCYDSKEAKQLDRTELSIRIGSPHEPAHNVDVLSWDANADVALLRILGLPKTYPVLSTCALRNARSGLDFIAAGFPQGVGYQPVPGVIGNTEGAGGRWAVAAAFAGGMSGGPILHKGFVVGLIKGGVGDTNALRTVVPVYKASLLAHSETGHFIPDCKVSEVLKPVTPNNVTKPGSSFVRKHKDAWVEGDGYSKKKSGSYVACESECMSDVRCKMLEFYRPTSTCNLFSDVLTIGAAANADVGVKTFVGQANPAITVTPDLKLWDHNGSAMTLEFEGSTRRFVYRQPKAALQARGVKQGTVLFEGKRSGPTYTGTSRLFRGAKCGEFAYPVSGQVAPDQKSVTLEGTAPVVDETTCKVTGSKPDKLVFKLIE